MYIYPIFFNDIPHQLFLPLSGMLSFCAVAVTSLKMSFRIMRISTGLAGCTTKTCSLTAAPATPSRTEEKQRTIAKMSWRETILQPKITSPVLMYILQLSARIPPSPTPLSQNPWIQKTRISFKIVLLSVG